MPAKTDELPAMEGEGVSEKRIKAIDDAADDWRSALAKRQNLLEKEVELRDAVVALMHKHGVTKYRYNVDDDTTKLLVLVGSEKLKLEKESSEESVETTEAD
jgi:hypothetical protein